MSRVHDLLIVGAGPAGSVAAATAAARGLDVVLVEPKRFPRDKVCGEFLSAEGCAVLGRLGLLQKVVREGAPRIGDWRISEPSGRSVGGRLPKLDGIGRDARGISREVLDLTLLRLAQGRGADTRIGWKLHRPLFDAGAVRGAVLRRVGHAARETRLRARVVLGADGRRSALMRALAPGVGDPRRTDDRSWFGLKAHYRGGAPRIEGRVELHVFDGGYAGVAEVEGGRLNLCMLVRRGALTACAGDADRIVTRRILRNPAAARVLAGLERCGDWQAIGPLAFGTRRPTCAGALFVGDAAGTIDPFGGEGMTNAMLAAELVVPYVERIVQAGDDAAPGVCGEWAAAWKRTFRPVTWRTRALSSLLARPRLAAFAVGALHSVARPLLPSLSRLTRTAH